MTKSMPWTPTYTSKWFKIHIVCDFSSAPTRNTFDSYSADLCCWTDPVFSAQPSALGLVWEKIGSFPVQRAQRALVSAKPQLQIWSREGPQLLQTPLIISPRGYAWLAPHIRQTYPHGAL